MAKGTQAATDTAPAQEPAKFVPKVIRQVSTNLLKLRAGTTVYVKVNGAMAKAKPLKKAEKTEDGKAKEPPTLMECTNLETGEAVSIICGAVLVDLLNDGYPSNGYVGKGFMIAVKEQKEAKSGGGRRYNNYNVQEIEVPK